MDAPMLDVPFGTKASTAAYCEWNGTSFCLLEKTPRPEPICNKRVQQYIKFQN